MCTHISCSTLLNSLRTGTLRVSEEVEEVGMDEHHHSPAKAYSLNLGPQPTQPKQVACRRLKGVGPWTSRLNTSLEYFLHETLVQCSHTIISMLLWISRWSLLCRWQWCFKYCYRLWGSKQRILLMNITASKQRVNMRLARTCWAARDFFTGENMPKIQV